MTGASVEVRQMDPRFCSYTVREWRSHLMGVTRVIARACRKEHPAGCHAGRACDHDFWEDAGRRVGELFEDLAEYPGRMVVPKKLSIEITAVHHTIVMYLGGPEIVKRMMSVPNHNEP